MNTNIEKKKYRVLPTKSRGYLRALVQGHNKLNPRPVMTKERKNNLYHQMFPVLNMCGGADGTNVLKFHEIIEDQVWKIQNNAIRESLVFCRKLGDKTYIHTTPLYFDIDDIPSNLEGATSICEYFSKMLNEITTMLLGVFNRSSHIMLLQRRSNEPKFHLYFPDIIVVDEVRRAMGEVLISKGFLVDTRPNITRFDGFSKIDKISKWFSEDSIYDMVDGRKITKNFYYLVYNFNAYPTEQVKDFENFPANNLNQDMVNTTIQQPILKMLDKQTGKTEEPIIEELEFVFDDGVKFKGMDLNSTDMAICKFFKHLYGKKWIYNNDTFFFKEEGLWRMDKSNKRTIMTLTNNVYEYMTNLMDNVLEMEDEHSVQHKTMMYKQRKKMSTLKNANKITSVLKLLKVVLLEDINWNIDPMSIVFKNGVYDLKTRMFKSRYTEMNGEEYINDILNTGYMYEEVDLEKVEFLKKNYLWKTFTNVEDREVVLQLLSTCLLGESVKQFLICVGDGNNNKTMFFEFILSMLGDKYGTKLDVNQLVGNSKKDTARLSALDCKRFIYAEEPQYNSVVKGSIIKDLTGGGRTDQRRIHSSESKVQLHNTLAMACNTKPNIKPFDKAMKQRVIVYPFDTTFTSNEEELNRLREQGRPAFKAKRYYASQQFFADYRMTLFHIFADYLFEFIEGGSEVKLTDNLKEIRDEYITDCDELACWFFDEFDEADDEDYEPITKADMWSIYRNSEYYTTLKREERITKSSILHKELTKSIRPRIERHWVGRCGAGVVRNRWRKLKRKGKSGKLNASNKNSMEFYCNVRSNSSTTSD